MKSNILTPNWRHLVALLCLIHTPISQSVAASITQAGREIYFEGEITKGDAERLAQTLSGGHYTSRVVLNSPGGDLPEALKIASLIQHAHLATRVSPQGICASACFFIFLTDSRRDASGIDEITVLKLSGSSSTYGPVGLHRPYMRPDLARTNPQTAMAVQQEVMTKTANYLKTKGVSQRLIDEMMDRPSNNIYWLSDHDILQLGEYPPAIEEALIAHCDYSRYRYHEKWTEERRGKLVDCIADFEEKHIVPLRLKAFEKLASGWRPWTTSRKTSQ